MNILITGGGGFIGSHLVDQLISNRHKITVVDDFSNGSLENISKHRKNAGFKLITADISNKKWIKKIAEPMDVIYHLACWPRSRSFTDPRRDIEVNLLGTINVLEYAKLHGSRVIFSSNSGIYDSHIQPIREGNPENPTTPYDVNKLASEHMIKAYNQAYNIPYTIFRFATVYGPRQQVSSDWHPVISTFINTLRRNEKPYVTGDGSQTRDFIYVSDIVDALSKGKDLQPSIGPLLLGSGVESSVIQALHGVCEVLERPIQYDFKPKPIGEIQRMSYDCSLARHALRWTPKVGLIEGITRQITLTPTIPK